MELFATLLLGLLAALLFTREVVAPASLNACDKRWQWLAGGMSAAGGVVSLSVGALFSGPIAHLALWRAEDHLSPLLTGLLAFLLTSLVFYGWHRAMHASDRLWRWTHQLHHSARRVEALTAFYAHPLDTLVAMAITCASSYLVLGASPLAAAFALFLTGALDLFVHADMRTPRWLGYFVQRPEMHTVHHQRGHHAQNYGLPLWDLLFGTWHNPEERVQDLGFDPERSSRVRDMLLGRDVHRS